MSMQAFYAILKLWNAKLEYGINWHMVYYPIGYAKLVRYLIDLFYDNPDYRFIGDTELQFHYKQW